MPVAAAGDLSLPFVKAAELLAASTTWQTVCAAASAAAALERVHLFGLDPAADDIVPCAIIGDEDALEQMREFTGDRSGEVLIEFLLALDEEDTLADQQITFRNAVGAILEDMRALARTRIPLSSEVYWGMTGWRKVVAPQVMTHSQVRIGVPDCIWMAVLARWT